MEAIRITIQGLKDTVATVLILAGALVLVFGIPVGWLWVASQLYGKTGAVNGSVAMFILVGIVLSYSLVLLIGSWVRARFGNGSDVEAQQIRRAVWNRSMRDTPYRPGARRADPVERLLVATAIVAGIGFLVWFAFLAGAPLPT
jgi:multisubunit Na+/H+ antiporter MnhC subunit